MKVVRKDVLITAAAAGAISLLVYLPALFCGFINLDDPFYITNNPLVKSLDPGQLLRLFTESHLGAWLPLTYLSFALDHHYWGDNPLGYHLTNILLHGFNVFLVVLLTGELLDRGRGDGGETGASYAAYLYPGILLFAGLLFGLHPLRVESVAWAAERKDVLNGLFTISALLAYVRFVRLKEMDGEKGGCWAAYLLAIILFILSLLAKQSSVTLPIILLLLDWYPLGRLHKSNAMTLIKEKIPFFLVSLLITWTTIHLAAAGKMLSSMGTMPLLVRLVVSCNAIFEYCRLSLLPVGISPYFVIPKPLPYSYSVKSALVVAATLLLARYAVRWRGAAAVWFCFVIALLPMLAFVQAGDDIALAARYTYLPAIALTIGAAAVLCRYSPQWLARKEKVPAVAGFCLLALFLCMATVMTSRLIKVWQNTGTFWTRVIETSPVGRAYGDRGVYYLINGRSDAAMKDFTAAIDIAGHSGVNTIYNLYAFRGVALSDMGRYDEAVADFDRAIAMFPHPTYFQQRGAALQALGRSGEAAADFRRAGPNPPPIDWFDRDAAGS